MNPWHVLAAACVCAVGALTFLKIVADEVAARRSEPRGVRHHTANRDTGRPSATQAEPTVIEDVSEKVA